MKIKCVETGIIGTNCYIVNGCENSQRFCMVIDPGDDFPKIKSELEEDVTHIILTHAHFDHIGALNKLHGSFPNAKICIGENEDISPEVVRAVALATIGKTLTNRLFPQDYTFVHPNVLLKDKDTICGFEVISTPGHTAGSICLYNKKEKILFSGDTIFYHNWGRTDLGGNDEDIMASVKKIMTLDNDVVVYPGHNRSTTIGAEKAFLYGGTL